MNFNYSKLRGKIIEKFDTISSFSDKCNMDSSVVSRTLNNKRSMTADDIVIMAKVLEIEPSEIGLYFFQVDVRNIEK